MTLSAPDLAIWRTAPYSVYFDAAIHNPATVFQARINMASVTYPVNVLTFDTVTVGAYTDLLPEQLLLLGTSTGSDDLGRVRIHATTAGVVATSTTINIGRSSQGRHDGEIDIADNMYITVLDLRMLWSAPPWIDSASDPDNPVTFKDGIIQYNTFIVFDPVVILGGDRLKIVDTVSDTATFVFSCADSYTTDPAADGTFTPTWDVGDGTITVGTVNSTTITVRYPVAAHDRYIACTIADNRGHTPTGYRLVMVKEKGNADLISKFTISRGTKRADGHDISLAVASTIPFDTYPDGTEILIRQRERYGSAQTGSLPVGQTDAEEMWFAGWLQSEQNTGEANRQGFIARSELTLLDAAGRMKTLPGFPQVVDRDSAPGRWEQMQGANLDRYGYWLWRWHSNLLTRVDYRWSGTGDTYGFSTLGSDGKSLWDQVSERTQAMAYVLTCDKNGRIWQLPDPYLAPTAQQVADFSLSIPARDNTVLVPFLTSDWSSYRYAYTRPPRIHWNWGNAIQVTTVDADSLTDIPTLFVVGPGQSPNQGLGEQTSGAQLAASLDELRVREGNRLAQRMNNKYGYLETDVRPGDAGYDPALMQSVSFTIDTATAGPRGRTMSAPHFLPIEVNYSYDAQKGLRRPTLTLEAEDPVGQVAVIDPQPQINQSQLPPALPPFVPPPTATPTFPSLINANIQRMALICVNGFTLTPDFQTPAALGGPTWGTLSKPWGGTLLQWVPNGFDPGSGWIVTTAEVGYLALSTGAYSVKHTFAATTVYRSADASFSEQNFFAVASYYPSGAGTKVLHTVNNSVFTETLVNSSAGTTVAVLGCVISSKTSGRIVIGAQTGTNVTAAYLSGDHGASWGTLSPAFSTCVFGFSHIHTPWNNNASDNIYYYATATAADVQFFYRNVGSAAPQNITPSIGGHSYTPAVSRNSIDSSPQNRQRMLMVGEEDTGLFVDCAAFLSNDGFVSSILIEQNANLRRGALAGDDGNYGWLWGVNALIEAITINSIVVTRDDRSGNLASLSPGEIIGLAGY